MSVDLPNLLEQAVVTVGKKLGVDLGAEQVADLAIKAGAAIADLISAKAWREAKAAGDEAASRITTLQDAEESAKRPR